MIHPDPEMSALAAALHRGLPDECLAFARSALIDADRAVELAEGGTIQVQAAALSQRALVKAMITQAMS